MAGDSLRADARRAMTGEDDFRAILDETGALREGHFVLSSGLHSAQYLQCALILQHPPHAERLGASLADRFRGAQPTAVIGPALGGILIAHEVARALQVRALFAERQDGVLRLRRDFSFSGSDRVVVVEPHRS